MITNRLFTLALLAALLPAAAGGQQVVQGRNYILKIDGTAARPSGSFERDQDTGDYRESENVWALATGGVKRLSISSSAVTSSVPLLAADGTAAAPSYAFASEVDLGMFRPTANTIDFANSTASLFRIDGVNGAITIRSDWSLGWASTGIVTPDVSLSRGAANRLDLASGDSFYLVSGGLGVGTVPPASGSITFTGTISPLTGTTIIGGTAIVSSKITSPSSTSGIGYATGAGGLVTQITNKATGVTLNTVTGEITLNAAALAAATAVTFVLTDSAIAAGDYVMVQHVSAGTVGAYVTQAVAAAGSASVTVTNRSAGSLSEAIVLKFVVFKATTS